VVQSAPRHNSDFHLYHHTIDFQLRISTQFTLHFIYLFIRNLRCNRINFYNVYLLLDRTDFENFSYFCNHTNPSKIIVTLLLAPTPPTKKSSLLYYLGAAALCLYYNIIICLISFTYGDIKINVNKPIAAKAATWYN